MVFEVAILENVRSQYNKGMSYVAVKAEPVLEVSTRERLCCNFLLGCKTILNYNILYTQLINKHPSAEKNGVDVLIYCSIVFIKYTVRISVGLINILSFL